MDGANTGSGRTLTMSVPKTKDFMRLLVQLIKGTAWALTITRCAKVDDPAAGSST